MKIFKHHNHHDSPDSYEKAMMTIGTEIQSKVSGYIYKITSDKIHICMPGVCATEEQCECMYRFRVDTNQGTVCAGAIRYSETGDGKRFLIIN